MNPLLNEAIYQAARRLVGIEHLERSSLLRSILRSRCGIAESGTTVVEIVRKLGISEKRDANRRRRASPSRAKLVDAGPSQVAIIKLNRLAEKIYLDCGLLQALPMG